MTAGQSGWSAPPEELGPAPGVEFGGYGSRLLGYIIDGIIIAGVTTVIILVGVVILAATSSVTLDQTGTVQSGTISAGGVTALFTAFLLALVFSVLYFPWFWARGGQTPGMRVTNIRVVADRDGTPISWGAAILRLIGFWISAAVFYIGFIWIFIDGRRRSWADLIAGTLVIKA